MTATLTAGLEPLDLDENLSTADRRAIAVDLYRRAADAGAPIAGSDLGPMVGRSASWGRQVVREIAATATAEHDPPVEHDPAPAEHDDGSASTAERRVTTLAVVVVALVAAVSSFDHQRELAAAAGEGWRAWMVPLSVDGLIVSASMAMRVNRRAGRPAGTLAWCALLLGVVASLAANVAAADPSLVGRIVAGWSPVALLLSHELLLRQPGGRQRSLRAAA